MKNLTNPLIRGEEVVIRGSVVDKNLEPLGWCGVGNINLVTTNHSEILLHIVGGRRRQPPIADVKAGDFIEAYGTVIEENAIAVTNPETHYLRLASIESLKNNLNTLSYNPTGAE